MKKLCLALMVAVLPAMGADVYTFSLQPAAGNIQGSGGDDDWLGLLDSKSE